MAESDPGFPGQSGPLKPVAVSVFGGLRIWRAGHEIDPGPRRNRLILAELLAAGGSVVSVSDMVDALWSFRPPGSAVNQVHRLVGQLRRTLEPGLSPHSNGKYVVPADGGYRLAVDLLDCDLFRFRQLARDADILLKAGQEDSASELYVTALELARGPLFGSLDSETVGRPEFLAIEQERVAVALVAAGIAADGGGSTAVLTAVVRIAASAPLNEALHARLMTLLAANGRSAEALIVFDQIRRRLADELGVDPSSDLRRAHQAVLALDQPPDEPSAALVEPILRPAQLPAALPGFVCRPEAQAALDESMSDTADSVGIAVIAGMGGIGKTALAAHWANQVRDHFPDGQLYVDLRGFDPSGRIVTASTALDMLLEGLGQSLADLSGVDDEGRVARYRSLTAGRKMIIMLDNVIDAEQVRPLIPSAPGSMVLITSRILLTSLVAREGARFVPLGRLPAPAALKILQRKVGAARLDHEPQAVDTILDHCDGLPLALAMLAARIATNPALSIRLVAERLAAANSTLDSMSIGVGRDDLRTVFSWSYDALTADAAQLFRSLAVHPGPEMSLASIATIAGLPTGQASPLVEVLISSHLLEEVSPRRFVMHDLLQDFAAKLIDDSGERTLVEHRLVDHYAASTRQAYLAWGRPPICELSVSTSVINDEAFETVHGSVDWYIRERAVLSYVIDLALKRGWNRQAIIMVLDQRPVNQAADAPIAGLPQTLRVLEVASTVGDKTLEAELERDAGSRGARGSAEAVRHLQQALRIFVDTSDLVGQAHTYRNLTNSAANVGNNELALQYAQVGLIAADRAGSIPARALLMISMSHVLLDLTRWQEAIETASQAVAIATQHGLEYLRSTLKLNMAEAYLQLGLYAQAVETATAGLVDHDEVDGSRWDGYGLLAVLAKSAYNCAQLEVATKACSRFEAMLADGSLEDDDYWRSSWRTRYESWIREVQSVLLTEAAVKLSVDDEVESFNQARA